MSNEEYEFRSATFGGFQRTDVINYLKRITEEHKQEVTKLHKQINDLENQRSALQAQLVVEADAKVRLAPLERQLAAQKEENSTLRGKNEELQKEAQALKEQLKTQQEVEVDVKYRQPQLEQALAAQEEENNALKAELEGAKQEAESLRQQLAAAAAQAGEEASTSPEAQERGAENAALQTELLALREENAALQAERDGLKQEAEALQKQLAQEQAEEADVKALQPQLQEALAAQQEENAQLRTERESLQAENQALQEQLRAQQAMDADTKAKQPQLEEENAALKQENQALQQQVAAWAPSISTYGAIKSQMAEIEFDARERGAVIVSKAEGRAQEIRRQAGEMVVQSATQYDQTRLDTNQTLAYLARELQRLQGELKGLTGVLDCNGENLFALSRESLMEEEEQAQQNNENEENHE